MNNYIFANLATKKLSSRAGSGTPIFTLGEENPTQVYFLDYPKPSSYSASTPPLGDAFTQSTNTINKNSSTFVLRFGNAIDSTITQQSSWSNLPSTISGQYVAQYEQTSSYPRDSEGVLLGGSLSITGNISLSPSPSFGAFKIRAAYRDATRLTNNYNISNKKFTNWVYIPFYASEVDIALALEEIYSNLIDFKIFTSSEELEIIDPPDPLGFDQELKASEFTLNQQRYNLERSSSSVGTSKINVIQSGDFSFFYSIRGTAIVSAAPGRSPSEIVFKNAIDTEIQTNELSAPYGKYASINFNSPQWDALLGNENEKEIWVDAVLDNKVVAQGTAILRKKLSV
jgi:hypothetical protein